MSVLVSLEGRRHWLSFTAFCNRYRSWVTLGLSYELLAVDFNSGGLHAASGT